MWYTKTKNYDYKFNLDPVRVPSKYPAKRYHRGPKIGQFSGNPLGKNPEDIWNIPHVKSNHIEKTIHPCQFPVGLVERLVLSLSNENDLIFDPFMGAGSTGVGSLLHGRYFWGTEKKKSYFKVAEDRLVQTLSGKIRYRPHDKPLYDYKKSRLSVSPYK